VAAPVGDPLDPASARDRAAVGFVGLGHMGAPMAGHLVHWPGGLVVCDAQAAATAPLGTAGALVASSPRAVAEQADLVSVMVRDDVEVREVVLGDDGVVAGAPPGTVVAIHSSIGLDTATFLAAEAAPYGVAVLDAPVSGGVLGAHDGTLAVMVGGPEPAVARLRPAFDCWAGLVVHVGPTGAGTRARVARTLLQYATYAAAGEAQRLAEAAGVDLRALAEVVRQSDATLGGPAAVMRRDTALALSRADEWYEPLARLRDQGEVDLALALALGRDLALDLPLAEAALGALAIALGVPHGHPDRHRRPG
jgi:3-hydroxyisobutyrate dehydrogenase-like beta-hydroxyacid dehydrogenase